MRGRGNDFGAHIRSSVPAFGTIKFTHILLPPRSAGKVASAASRMGVVSALNGFTTQY